MAGLTSYRQLRACYTCAFVHTHQSEPTGASDRVYIETDSIVVNGQARLPGPTQANPDVFGMGMFDDIVERFLRDTVNARGGLEGSLGKRVDHSELDRNSFPVTELVAQISESPLKPQILQNGRVQLPCDLAGLFGDTECTFLRRLKTPPGRAKGGQFGGNYPNLSGKGTQMLAEGVVDFARDSPAFLFLGGYQAGRERTYITLVCGRQLLQALLLCDVPPDRKNRRDPAGVEFGDVTHFVINWPIGGGVGKFDSQRTPGLEDMADRTFLQPDSGL
jgi:hypothetical protein